MAVTEQIPVNSSTGNGVTTVFPYTFKILAAADLEVTVDGVVKTLNTHYTVSGAGSDAGGNVTFTTAPANLTTVVRRRNMAFTRSTDYQQQGDLPTAVLNADQDAPVLMIQQVAEEMGRTLKAPAGDSSMEDLPAASDRASMFLVFDAQGNPTVSSGTGADSGLRADLAAADGSALVGVRGDYNVLLKLRERVSAFELLTVSERAEVVAGTLAFDVTTKLQQMADEATDDGIELLVNAGQWSTSGLKLRPFSRTVFDPNAVLVMRGDGFGIRTVSAAGGSLPTGNIRRVQLHGARVDMAGYDGIGILLECVTASVLSDAFVSNIGTGTFDYNDGVDAMVGLLTSGVALKGISGVYGAYYNELERIRTTGGNVGLWLGTSTSTRTSKANHNLVNKPVCMSSQIGIHLHTADDNMIVQPDCSSSVVDGIRVGVIGGGVKTCNRNRLVANYLELCATGLNITTESAGTQIDGIQSIIGTTTPVTDNGSGTSLFYPKRIGDAEKYARFYDQKVKGVTELEICASGGTVVGKITEGSGSTRVQIQNVDGAGVELMTGAASAGTSNAAWRPISDNAQRLGSASFRWSEVFAGNAAINTSDERLKQDMEAIPQEILDAWGDVQFVRFKWEDAVQRKGSGARWHFGLIAQRVKAAFEARGLDPFALGLLCYDEWEDEIEDVIEEVAGTDDDGRPVMRMVKTGERLRVAAGSRYGIRYEEALALECALQRSVTAGLQTRLAALEAA